MREAMVRPKHSIFGSNSALIAGTLHEHTLPVDVSCREDVWHVALQVVVDRDITVGCLHASGSPIERIHAARPTIRKEARAYSQAGGRPLIAGVPAHAALDL